MSAKKLTTPNAMMKRRPERLSKVVMRVTIHAPPQQTNYPSPTSGAQNAARRLRHGRDNLLRDSFDLCVRQRLVLRLQPHADGERFLAVGHAFAFIDIEDVDAFDEIAFGRLR